MTPTTPTRPTRPTTTTVTRPTPATAVVTVRRQLQAPTPFAPQAAGETLAALGERAMRYALALDVPIFSQLSDTAVAAAADAITHAVTQRDISQTTLACLQGLQRDLRLCLRARLQRLQALFDAADTLRAVVGPDASQGPADAPQGPSQGGGGSKVRRPAGPTRPTPPAGGQTPPTPAPPFKVPALQLGADAF